MMETMHDLGGKQGFGPVPIGDNEGFHHDWERRTWALARAGVVRDITIDWFRHGLERMVPADYLTFPYFKKWVTNYLMLIIDNGAVTMAEALKGHVETPDDPAAPLTLAEVLDKNRDGAVSFEIKTDAAPAFSVGDTVLTKRLSAARHSRLPAYARGAHGTIIAHHGAHALPDKGALGIHAGEHLYTVSFSALELWGPDANPGDTVTLELWECYLVRP